MRPLSLALLLIGVTAAAYLGSFWAVRTAVAAPTPCGGGAPPCGYYYAGQLGDTTYASGVSDGIQGNIVAEGVLWDPAHDGIANWIGLGNPNAPQSQFLQAGFFEGKDPLLNVRYVPTVYTERLGSGSCSSYAFKTYATNQLTEYPQIFRYGGTVPCNGVNVSLYLAREFVNQGNGTINDLVKMSTSSGRFEAETEHHNNVYMEPNGAQCFGIGPGESCSTTDLTYSLALFNKSTGYWGYWDTSHRSIRGDGNKYHHNVVRFWDTFYTTADWQ